jgi:predicted DNA-binding protein YlxM (UPF0122 family)
MTKETFEKVLDLWYDGDNSIAAIAQKMGISVDDVQSAIRHEEYKETKWYALQEGISYKQASR